MFFQKHRDVFFEAIPWGLIRIARNGFLIGYLLSRKSITDILYSFVFSSSNFFGKTRLRMTPMTAERPMPEMAKLPEESTAPPNPMVSITEMMITLRVLFISTLFCIKFCTPTLAMVPKSKSMMPPNTACGMLCNKALNFPTMEKQMAVAAEMRITAGLVTLVIDMAPVTSE